MGQCSAAVTGQCHPLSVFSLLLAIQHLFTLNFKMKLKRKIKKLGIIFGQDDKSEV